MAVFLLSQSPWLVETSYKFCQLKFLRMLIFYTDDDMHNILALAFFFEGCAFDWKFRDPCKCSSPSLILKSPQWPKCYCVQRQMVRTIAHRKDSCLFLSRYLHGDRYCLRMYWWGYLCCYKYYTGVGVDILEVSPCAFLIIHILGSQKKNHTYTPSSLKYMIFWTKAGQAIDTLTISTLLILEHKKSVCSVYILAETKFK